MIRRLTSFFVFFAMIWAMPVFAMDQIEGLKIGALDAYPYNVKGDNTFDQAYSSLLSKAGLKGEISFVPFKRGLNGVETGIMDLMVPVVRNAKREKQMAFPERPYMSLPFVLFHRAEDNFEWKGDPEALNGKTLGMLRGAFHSKRVSEKIAKGEIQSHLVKDFQQMMILVDRGRIDFGVGSLWAFKENAKALGLQERIVASKMPYKILNMYIAVNRIHPRAEEITKRISTVIEEQGPFVAW